MKWHRIKPWLFRPYQLMLLEPKGGQTVRNMRINRATGLSMLLLLTLGSAWLAWYFAPPHTEAISARSYQLKQQNHDLRDQIATYEGELALANEQIDGLKNELLASQQRNEEIQQSRNIYESILEARKSSGVRILRASASLEEGNNIKYNIVLVKGGNYPRSVSGSVRLTAYGSDGQQWVLKADAKGKDIPYRMDTHAFLEGNVIWTQEWQPIKLQITRMNYQGAERDQVDIDLEEKKTQ
jgi:hypothetical protein